MEIIEIRDPKLNKTDLLKRVATQMEGKVIPDFGTIGPEKLRHTAANAASPEEGKESGNHEAFIDLMLSHQLEEPEFSSEAPIIGPWIVRLRQMWNWMSTKWYVLPIIKQQSEVNGQVAILLLEMETWINEKNQTIADLQEKVNRLESIMAANRLNEK
jgi:hypothetical protein